MNKQLVILDQLLCIVNIIFLYVVLQLLSNQILFYISSIHSQLGTVFAQQMMNLCLKLEQQKLEEEFLPGMGLSVQIILAAEQVNGMGQ